MPHEHLASLRITAELLRSGRWVNLLSIGLTVAALVLAVCANWVDRPGWAALLAAVAVLGLCQAYLALRVNFDAALFGALCAGRELEVQQMAHFDQAMLELELLPAQKAGRAWSQRCRGAMRLLRLQMGLAFAQVVLWLAGIVAMPMD